MWKRFREGDVKMMTDKSAAAEQLEDVWLEVNGRKEVILAMRT